MNSKQIESGLLINEWQLGTQLNVALTNGTRDKFNLLLALLSVDARDFSQFKLPKATQESLTQQALRESLSLPIAQPLVNVGYSLQQAKKVSIAAHNKDLSDIRLQSLLNNEAILSRISNPSFDVDVVDNLSFLAQRRLKSEQTQDEEAVPSTNGVDYALLKSYEDLNLKDKPVTVRY